MKWIVRQVMVSVALLALGAAMVWGAAYLYRVPTRDIDFLTPYISKSSATYRGPQVRDGLVSNPSMHADHFLLLQGSSYESIVALAKQNLESKSGWSFWSTGDPKTGRTTLCLFDASLNGFEDIFISEVVPGSHQYYPGLPDPSPVGSVVVMASERLSDDQVKDIRAHSSLRDPFASAPLYSDSPAEDVY